MAINLIELNARQGVHIFKGRTDRVVLYTKGKEVAVSLKRGEYELISRLEDHLAGTVRCAFYPMQDDGTVNWAVINFAPEGPSEDLKGDSLLLTRELRKLGFRSVRRERTMRPQEEYNVWIFFRPPVSAKKVRHMLFMLFEKLGFSRKIPIVPATDELQSGSFGQHIWVPYFNGIDKWLDEEGTPYVCQGLKSDQTVFIDDEGKTIEQFIMEIPFNSEGDADRAITAMEGELAGQYAPGQGLVIGEQAFFKMLEGCVAFKSIIDKIETEGILNTEGQLRLGALLRGLGLERLLQEYLNKIKDYSALRFEKAHAKYPGLVFPTCAEMKTIGFCPENKNCFMMRSPLKERLGFWQEEKGGKATIEPNVSPYLFKAIGEQPPQKTSDGDEGDSSYYEEPSGFQGMAPKVESKPASEFAPAFMEWLEEKSSRPPESLSGFNTGLDSLNEITGGLIPGTLTCLAGGPGAGKTTLAKQLLDTVADKDKAPVLYVAYDHSVRELHLKTLARLSGVSAGQLLSGSLNDEEKAKVRKVNNYTAETLGNLICILEADSTVNSAAIEKAAKDSGAVLLAVDPLQLICPEGRTSNLDGDSRLRILLGQLKQLSVRLNLATLVISNSPVTDGLLYGADTVLHLYSLSPATAQNPERQVQGALLNIEKSRLGKSPASIQLTFFPQRMVFYGDKKIDYRPIR